MDTLAIETYSEAYFDQTALFEQYTDEVKDVQSSSYFASNDEHWEDPMSENLYPCVSLC